MCFSKHIAVPLLIVLLHLSTALGAEISGHIVGVHDGDTITLLDSANHQHKIRLAGIDAPETRQPFGTKSKSNLSTMVYDKDVTAECSKTDKYKRQVCKVIVDGTDINLEQLKAGMAWHYKQYAKEQSLRDRDAYEVAELNAKAQQLGLWADRNPVAPWEWRHRGMTQSGM